MKRILIIPHSANKQVRVRLSEVGRVLGRKHKVFCLDWQEPLSSSFPARLKAASFNVLAPLRASDYKGLSLVSMPFFHRPLSLRTGSITSTSFVYQQPQNRYFIAWPKLFFSCTRKPYMEMLY